MSFIDNLNNKLSPYYSLLLMLGFFGTIIITAFNFIIAPSDLKINVRTDNVTYPNSISEDFDEIRQFLSRTENDSLTLHAVSAINFLKKTTDIRIITLKNDSDKTLRDVEFKYLNANELTAYSITTSFLTSKEQDILYKNLVIDDNRKIIHLRDKIDIPPGNEVTISLWGSFIEDSVNKNIIVNYSDGEGFIEQTYELTGLKGYFANYSLEFLLITIIIFSIVYSVGINETKKVYQKNQD